MIGHALVPVEENALLPNLPETSSVSSARAFFDHLRNQPDPLAFLTALASPTGPEPAFEEEWLDFKGRPQDDKDARKIWSKALSGYANITDGLVIWGIDARKDEKRGIDAACGVRLIHDAHSFESWSAPVLCTSSDFSL